VPHNILYVDDEAHNLDAFRRAFFDADFVDEILTTTSPDEALALLDKHDVAVVVSDQRMPGMNGTELLARVLEKRPGTVRLILTAYTDVRDVIDAINRGHIYSFVTKPWDADGLRAILRRALEHHDTSEELARKKKELEEALAQLEEAHLEQLRLTELVVTDEKTGVRNFHYLRVRLGEEFERARRYDAELSLVLVDIDSFKPVNEEHGHVFGDRILAELAQVLVEGQRAVDIVARYDGEAFVILLPETGRAQARAIAERIRQRAETHVFGVASGQALHITVSCGVSVFPHAEVASKEDLIALADRALYQAKAQGRNRVVDL
jgi:diguanylate cyclase (GGDEF)-like protein